MVAFCASLRIEAAGEDDHRVEIGGNDDLLPAAPFGAEDLGRVQPPLVAVAITVRRRRLLAGRRGHPARGHDLLVRPAPLMKEEIAELRHVVGREMQVSPAERRALRAGRPDRFADAERPEEMLSREVERGHPGGFLHDDGEEIGGRAAIFEPRPGWLSHGQVKGELGPVRTPHHLLQRRLSGLGVAAEAGAHRQQMLQRHRLFARVHVRHVAAGKQIEHRLLDALDVARVDRDPDERGSEAFAAGRQVVQRARREGIEVDIGRDVAVADHEQAVKTELLLDNEVAGFRQLLRVDPQFLGRLAPPPIGRPILRRGVWAHLEAFPGVARERAEGR